MARSMQGGMGTAVRAAAVPFTLGMRWARHGMVARAPELPPVRWSPGLVSKVILDDVFFASEVALATFVSLGHRHRLAEELGACLEMYERRGWLDDPASYHVTPPPLDQVRSEHVRSVFGSHRRIHFESGYAPHPGEPGGERYLSWEANRTAHAWLFEHPGAPRPWLVCVPGYRMGSPLADRLGFRVNWLHRRLGLNVAVPVMPLHGPRRIGRRNGDHFLSGDFVDTIHAHTQSVWDIRRLIGWLRRRRAEQVGVYGVSLGGYTTSLLAAVEDDMELVIVGIPATDFVGLLEAHMPEFATRWAGRLGFPFDELRRILRVISPLAIPARVPHDRRFIYAGSVDSLVHPSQALALWEHWDRPQMNWYDGSHVSFIWERRVEGIVRGALAHAGMIRASDAPLLGPGATV